MKPARIDARRCAAGALVALIVVSISACGGEDSRRDKPKRDSDLKLTIGNSVPLSGSLSDFGPAAKKSGKLALEQIEKAIEKTGDGDSVNLITVDNESDRAAAVSSAEGLVADGGSCIVGPWGPVETIDVARTVAIPDRVALISPAATVDELSGLADNDGLVSRTVPPDSAQGAVLASLIADDLGEAKDATVNVAARDGAYGQNVANAFVDAWKSKGGKVGELVIFGAGDKRADSVAEGFVSGDPDAGVIVDFPESFKDLAAALAETPGYEPSSIWAPDSLASTELSDAVPGQALEGLRTVAPGVADSQAQAIAFEKLFSEADPSDVERASFDAQTFDAVLLCYLAAVAAQSTSGTEIAGALNAVAGPPGRRYTWEQLPRAVEALRSGKEIDFEGASGPLDLDPEGDPVAGAYDVYEFDDGRLVLVDEVPAQESRARR